MLRVLTTVALLALPGTTLAADPMANPPADARTNLVEDPGWGFYVEGYGGIVTQTIGAFDEIEDFGGGFLSHDEFFDNLTGGPTFGVSAGVRTPIDGLSVGVDVMHTHAGTVDFGDFEPVSIDTLSIMGTVEGAYHLSPQFDLYATGGLGAMRISYDDGFGSHGEGWTPAYQVAVGVRANVTENLSVFTELKHQDVFAPASVGDVFDAGDADVTIAKGNTAVLAGVRFSF